MGIRFIFGRAGSGKSYYCLNQIKKKLENDKNNKLILLVPRSIYISNWKEIIRAYSEKEHYLELKY